MTVEEFLTSFLGLAEKDAKERLSKDGSRLELPPKEVKKLCTHLMLPFTKPQRKRVLSELKVREDITPQELIANLAAHQDGRGGHFTVVFDSGEFNHDGFVKNAALSLITFYFYALVESPPPAHPSMPPVGPSLATDIDLAIRFKESLEKTLDGKFRISPEDAKKLREELSESIIDARAYLHWLDSQQLPGQYS